MATKITAAALSTFLKSVGLDVELVANESEATFNQDEALQLIDANRKSVLEPQIINAQKDGLHSQITASTNRAYYKALSELTGVPKEVISGKSADEATKAAFEHYKASSATGDKDVQAKIAEILENAQREKSELVKTHEQKYAELTQKYTDKQIIEAIAEAHKNAKGLPPTANVTAMAKLFYDAKKAEGNVHFKVNDDGTVEIRDAKNNELPVFNETKTSTLKLGDLLKPHYESLGLWSTDTRDVKPMDRVGVNSNSNGGLQADQWGNVHSATQVANGFKNYPQEVQEWSKNF